MSWFVSMVLAKTTSSSTFFRMPHRPRPGRQGSQGPSSNSSRMAVRGGSPPEQEHESVDAKEDRQLIELLNELRVALPGVQMLFGFMLAVPFTQRFGALSESQRLLFYIAFLATASASI